jgi:hypothetical protein
MFAEVKKSSTFDLVVSDWIDEVKTAAEDVAVGVAKVIFNHAIYNGPQYSGDYVANWKVSIGTLRPEFDHNAIGGVGRVPRYKKGSVSAIQYAQSRADFSGFKLGQTLYLHNSAAHDEPHAWLIENNMINFRPVNAGAHSIMRRSVAFAMNRFGKVGPTQLAALRKVGV